MLLAKHHGRRIASALLVLGLSMVVITGCPTSGGPGAKTPAATKAVGAVDVEVLQGLDEFKAAQKKFEEEAKQLQAGGIFRRKRGVRGMAMVSFAG